jgi:hypothetical protein
VLAYAFWHWKRSEVPREVYEARQCAFQEALAADPPVGFVGGSTVRLRGASWAAEGAVAYEDWYRIGDMAALGSLNEAAVTGSRRASHHAVAELAAGGIAGVYRLRLGTALPAPRFSRWFAKPAGMSYAALDEALTPVVAGDSAAFWCRQMTLGPTPEFCLQAPAPIDLPAELSGLDLALEPIFGRAR